MAIMKKLPHGGSSTVAAFRGSRIPWSSSPSLPPTAATRKYVSDLVAAAAIIYLRDLNTTLNLGNVGIWKTTNINPKTGMAEPDPYTATTVDGAMSSFATIWHDKYCDTPLCAKESVNR